MECIRSSNISYQWFHVAELFFGRTSNHGFFGSQWAISRVPRIDPDSQIHSVSRGSRFDDSSFLGWLTRYSNMFSSFKVIKTWKLLATPGKYDSHHYTTLFIFMMYTCTSVPLHKLNPNYSPNNYPTTCLVHKHLHGVIS